MTISPRALMACPWCGEPPDFSHHRAVQDEPTSNEHRVLGCVNPGCHVRPAVAVQGPPALGRDIYLQTIWNRRT